MKTYIMGKGDDMNKEIKRQFMCIGILLCLLVGTMFLWYRNFIFHSYVDRVDYLYSYSLQDDDFMIDGLQATRKSNVSSFGGGRLLWLDNQMKANDEVILTYHVNDKSLKQKVKVKANTQMLSLNVIDPQEAFDDVGPAWFEFDIQIMRKGKSIYQKSAQLHRDEVVHYTGNNKHYSLQNVFVTPSTLKTGDFYTTDPSLFEDYPFITIDYLIHKGDDVQINDYERFANVSGKTEDILENQHNTLSYYQGEGSLLDYDMICVVTLYKSTANDDKFSFAIQLEPKSKVVE